MSRRFPDYDSWHADREKRAAATRDEMRIVDAELAALKKKHRQLSSKYDRLRSSDPPRYLLQRELIKAKTLMVAAHPDRGGSNEAFIVARRRYEMLKDQERYLMKWKW
jgi:hypothetical protein